MHTNVSALSEELKSQLDGRDIIVFDAVCVLCSNFYKFVLKHDRAAQFSFVTAQSGLGQAIYAALDLPRDDFDTNLVIIDGQIYQRLDSFNQVMRCFGGFWHILTISAVLPKGLRDFLYYKIARNRYRIWGKYATCIIPDAAVRDRFLPNGYSQ